MPRVVIEIDGPVGHKDILVGTLVRPLSPDQLVTRFKEVASLCAISTYGQEPFPAICVVWIPLANGIVLFVRLPDTPLLLTTPLLPVLLFDFLELVSEDFLGFVQERMVILGLGGCCA